MLREGRRGKEKVELGEEWRVEWKNRWDGLLKVRIDVVKIYVDYLLFLYIWFFFFAANIVHL